MDRLENLPVNVKCNIEHGLPIVYPHSCAGISQISRTIQVDPAAKNPEAVQQCLVQSLRCVMREYSHCIHLFILPSSKYLHLTEKVANTIVIPSALDNKAI